MIGEDYSSWVYLDRVVLLNLKFSSAVQLLFFVLIINVTFFLECIKIPMSFCC